MKKTKIMVKMEIDGKSMFKRNPTKKQKSIKCKMKEMVKYRWVEKEMFASDLIKEKKEYEDMITRKHKAHQRRVTKKKVLESKK